MCSVKDDRIQRRLLVECKLDFKKVFELATATKVALKNL